MIMVLHSSMQYENGAAHAHYADKVIAVSDDTLSTVFMPLHATCRLLVDALLHLRSVLKLQQLTLSALLLFVYMPVTTDAGFPCTACIPH